MHALKLVYFVHYVTMPFTLPPGTGARDTVENVGGMPVVVVMGTSVSSSVMPIMTVTGGNVIPTVSPTTTQMWGLVQRAFIIKHRFASSSYTIYEYKQGVCGSLSVDSK